MNQIHEWLAAGKDYTTGLALLSKHSKNRVLFQNLSRKHHPAKLEYELRKINPADLPQIKVTDTVEIKPEPNTLQLSGKPRIDPEALPAHLKPLWDETAEKHRLARAVHEQLKQMGDERKRAAHIELLENYRQEIRKNWDVIDTWWKEQQISPEQNDIDDKRINANRKYLSDGKKSVGGLNGAIRAKKLEAMQKRINELLVAGEKFESENQKVLEELGLKFNG